MNRIIRLNAIETLNQSDMSGRNFHNLHPLGELVSEKVFIYEVNVASLETGALPAAPVSTQTTTKTFFQTETKSTTDGFISLQKRLLHQPTRAFSASGAIKSIAFFTAVVFWAWTGKIEQVSHVRGKFVALGELNKLQSQYLGKVINTAIQGGQDLIPTQVIPEVDNLLLNGEVKTLTATEEPFTQITTLMDKTGLLAQTRAAIAVVNKQAAP
ncbi:MAG: hypothetical protein SAK29_40220 [Scytonema sp. PMC 1069.18]|nr:hypothetical protein [Scytonema sp. PMC 1069.18]MEC4880887.1 hypothetical protein [Scytonema sp. PMC 1070.18]